jgi:2,4-dienoyl-CoA reductase-like NADH-dependent reductase (Old Yellow Enzyme family)/thioredoxin reductase
MRNRIVHASMSTGRAEGSRVTEALVGYYANRARGGAALVVSEPLASLASQNVPTRVRVWDDAELDGLSRWAEGVRRYDSQLIGQLQHSGRGWHEPGRNPDAVGASSLPDDLSWTVPRALHAAEIEQMLEGFALAAARLERCGFSGVELSSGHGHLFHQFLSPWSNRRQDKYGGDFAGRLRFLRELVRAIRSVTGSEFILGLKLPGDDGVAGSIDEALAGEIAAALDQDGHADYFAFCQGSHAPTLDWHIPDMHWPRAPWMPLITRLRTRVRAPVIALGLITDPAEAEGILQRDEADLIGLGRALVADPAWGLKASRGEAHRIRYCVSCNTCWGEVVAHRPLACDNNPRVAAPDEVDYWPKRSTHKRRITIVGSGIAGVEAAWVAAARGHEVTALGAGAQIGGSTRLHAALPGGEALSSIYDYQWHAARRAGVRFELGLKASPDDVLATRPDAVVLATGASMLWPPGLPSSWQDEGLVRDLRAAMRSLSAIRERQPGTAVVFDMDHTAGTYAAALRLRDLFTRVILVTPRERVAADVPLVTQLGLYRRLAHANIEVVAHAELSPASVLEDGIVRLFNIYTGTSREIEDVVLLSYATPRASNDALDAPLRATGIELHSIGDCRVPGTVLRATAEGHAAGSVI